MKGRFLFCIIVLSLAHTVKSKIHIQDGSSRQSISTQSLQQLHDFVFLKRHLLLGYHRLVNSRRLRKSPQHLHDGRVARRFTKEEAKPIMHGVQVNASPVIWETSSISSRTTSDSKLHKSRHIATPSLNVFPLRNLNSDNFRSAKRKIRIISRSRNIYGISRSKNLPNKITLLTTKRRSFGRSGSKIHQSPIFQPDSPHNAHEQFPKIRNEGNTCLHCRRFWREKRLSRAYITNCCRRSIKRFDVSE